MKKPLIPEVELRARLLKILKKNEVPLYRECKAIGMSLRTILDFIDQRRTTYWKTLYKIKEYVDRKEKEELR